MSGVFAPGLASPDQRCCLMKRHPIISFSGRRNARSPALPSMTLAGRAPRCLAGPRLQPTAICSQLRLAFGFTIVGPVSIRFVRSPLMVQRAWVTRPHAIRSGAGKSVVTIARVGATRSRTTFLEVSARAFGRDWEGFGVPLLWMRNARRGDRNTLSNSRRQLRESGLF